MSESVVKVKQSKAPTFKKEWLVNPKLCTWLQEVVGNPHAAYCVACERELSSKLSTLLDHSKSLHHKQYHEMKMANGEMKPADPPNIAPYETYEAEGDIMSADSNGYVEENSDPVEEAYDNDDVDFSEVSVVQQQSVISLPKTPTKPKVQKSPARGAKRKVSEVLPAGGGDASVYNELHNTLKRLHGGVRDEDPHDVFGKHVAASLRLMSKKQQAIARLKIQNIIYEGENELLKPPYSDS